MDRSCRSGLASFQTIEDKMSELMTLSLWRLFTYRAGLNKLRVDVFVCWRGCDLQHDLDEATRKVLDKDQLAQRLLEQ